MVMKNAALAPTSSTQPEVRTITAAEFKAKCLQLMDEVNEKKITLIITKRGKPVMRALAPVEEQKPFRSIVGRAPNIKIYGDIISPVVEWVDPGDKWLAANGKTKRKKETTTKTKG